MVYITISGGFSAVTIPTNPPQVGKRLLVASGMESAELDEYLDMALNLSDQCMSLKVPMVPWYHGRAIGHGARWLPSNSCGWDFFWAFGLMAHGIFGEISGRNLQYLWFCSRGFVLIPMQCWHAFFWVLSGEPLVFAGEKRAFNIPSQTFIGVFLVNKSMNLVLLLDMPPHKNILYLVYLVYLVTIEHQWAVSPVVNGSGDSNSLTLSIPPSDGSLKSTDHRQGAENANRNLVDLIPIPKVNPTFPGANDEMMTGWTKKNCLRKNWILIVVIYGYS